MSQAELLRVVEAHERAENELQASSLAVWVAFADAEPALATEILQLFSTVDAAAHWTASSFSKLGDSPARLAAVGRAAEILSKIRMTAHGFVG